MHHKGKDSLTVCLAVFFSSWDEVSDYKKYSCVMFCKEMSRMRPKSKAQKRDKSYHLRLLADLTNVTLVHGSLSTRIEHLHSKLVNDTCRKFYILKEKKIWEKRKTTSSILCFKALHESLNVYFLNKQDVMRILPLYLYCLKILFENVKIKGFFSLFVNFYWEQITWMNYNLIAKFKAK